jgi:3-methyladenine DNA glycosylase AlkD
MPDAAVTARSILAELQSLGNDGYKRILQNHGIKEPVYGVKIEYLKKIQKRIKSDHQLALHLFATGVYDAQYLAGLMADDAKMTRRDLNRWVNSATSQPVCSYTISSVAAGSPHGHGLAMEWIDSKKEHVAATGWATLSAIVSVKPDDELDLAELRGLIQRIVDQIQDAPNAVRYAMNGFLIAVGSYVKALTPDAIAAAKKIGVVEVDMGNTSCKVPDAAAYIDKVKKRGTLGKKRKSAKC